MKLRLEVEEITSANEFYAMRQDWNHLVNDVADNTFFLCWERMAPAVRYLEKGSTLKILCIKDGGDLLGIVPLKKFSRSVIGLLNYTMIESISERAPGILLKKRKTECLHTIMTHLYAQKDWDFLNFNDIPETFSIVNLLQASSKINFELEEGDVSPYITIPNSLSELYNYIKPSFRHNLRNDLRRLEKKHGEVTLKEYCELGSLEEMMEKFFELHQKRWESKRQPGVFKTKRLRDIFLAEAKLFSEIDCLRLRFLLAGQKPISVFYGYEHNKTLYYLLSGFDPSYASFGPTNLLLLKTLEKCVEEEIRELNFFSGYTSHKFRWCKNYRRNYSFKFINSKVRSKALSLAARIARQKNINDKLWKILKIASLSIMGAIMYLNLLETLEMLFLSF